MSADVNVRLATLADLPAITALYNRFVADTIVNFDVTPFTVEQRGAWFVQFAATGRYRLLVAKIDGAFAGYAGSMRHKEKAAYETSVETTIYVEPACARRGVGRALYQRLFEALRGEDVHSALAGIALPNEASVRLHEGFDFRPIGVFHEVGRKFGRYWDVLWMEKRL